MSTLEDADSIHVLVVNHDEVDVERIREALADEPFCVHRSDSLSALGDATLPPVDVVLIELDDDRERTDLHALSVPVIALTSPGQEEPRLRAMSEGAVDYVAKDEIDRRLLPRSLRYALDVHRLENEVQRRSHVDALTGLHNRLFLWKQLDAAFNAARRHQHPLSIAVGDVDDFKAVNDRYGHLIGDAVLRGLARVLSEGVRREDTLARYAGDEFCLVLPHDSLAEAQAVVGRAAAAIGELELRAGDDTVRVTMTFGVATLSPAHRDARALFDEADAALMAAKSERRRGR